VLISFHYIESSSTIFIYLSCLLNSQDIFKMRRFFLQSGISPCQNAASLSACPIETPQRQHFLVALTSAAFISADILRTAG